MKRIPITIQFKKNPEVSYLAYALSNEINDKSIAFFSTFKVMPDVEMIIKVIRGENTEEYNATLSQINEQISSGKIMNAIPSDHQSFPARTFYRCYAKVSSQTSATAETQTEEAKAA